MDKSLLFVVALAVILSLISPVHAADAGNAIAIVLGLVIGEYNNSVIHRNINL